MNTPADVHVWLRRVTEVDADTSILDAAELARAAQLAQSVHRSAYVALHTLARHALSEMFNAPPESWTFERTCPDCVQPHGKPFVRNHGARWISLSRNDTHAAVAVCTSGRVGIDIEHTERFQRVPAEVVLHSSEPREGVDAAHLARAWTRKEAALKADGIGLRTEPWSFVTPLVGVPCRVPHTATPLIVTDLPRHEDDIVGAVALERPPGGNEVRVVGR